MGEADGVELEATSARPQRRARIALGAAALVVVGALVASQLPGGEASQLASGGGDVEAPDDDEVQNRPGDPSTSSTETTTSEGVTATTSGDGSPGTSTDGDASPIDGSTAPEDTTTTTVCQNSFDPGCGAFRWTTSVHPNQPLTVTMEVITEHPVVGHYVEVRVTSSDPDATPVGLTAWIGSTNDQDDGFEMSTTNCFGHGTQQGYGPWSPPTPRPGAAEAIVSVYAHDTGLNRLTGCFTSSSWVYPTDNATLSEQRWCPGDGETIVFEGWACADPYRSFASPILDFNVYAS